MYNGLGNPGDFSPDHSNDDSLGIVSEPVDLKTSPEEQTGEDVASQVEQKPEAVTSLDIVAEKRLPSYRISKWFPDKGYGFVDIPEKGRVFLHARSISPYQEKGADLSGVSIIVHGIKETDRGLAVERASLEEAYYLNVRNQERLLLENKKRKEDEAVASAELETKIPAIEKDIAEQMPVLPPAISHSTSDGTAKWIYRNTRDIKPLGFNSEKGASYDITQEFGVFSTNAGKAIDVESEYEGWKGIAPFSYSVSGSGDTAHVMFSIDRNIGIFANAAHYHSVMGVGSYPIETEEKSADGEVSEIRRTITPAGELDITEPNNIPYEISSDITFGDQSDEERVRYYLEKLQMGGLTVKLIKNANRVTIGPKVLGLDDDVLSDGKTTKLHFYADQPTLRDAITSGIDYDPDDISMVYQGFEFEDANFAISEQNLYLFYTNQAQFLRTITRLGLLDQSLLSESRIELEELEARESAVKSERQTENINRATQIIDKILTQIPADTYNSFTIAWDKSLGQDFIKSVQDIGWAIYGYNSKLNFSEPSSFKFNPKSDLEIVKDNLGNLEADKLANAVKILEVSVPKIESLISEFTRRRQIEKSGEAVFDFGGSGNKDWYLVVNQDGSNVEPSESKRSVRESAINWPIINSEQVAIYYNPNKPGRDKKVAMMPAHPSDSQLQSIWAFEAQYNLPKGYFGEKYELGEEVRKELESINSEISVLAREVPRSISIAANFPEIEDGADLARLHSENGINILSYIDRNDFINERQPFDQRCEGRDAQIAFRKNANEGELQILAYYKFGYWNANLRLVNLAKEEEEMENTHFSLEDLKNRFGK